MTASRRCLSSEAIVSGLTVVESRGMSREDVGRVLTAHCGALAGGSGVLKNALRTAVTRVSDGDKWLCVKEFRRAGYFDALKDRLRRSRAVRAWAGSRLLAENGIQSPEALAVAAAQGTSFLITRFIADATPLDRLVTERFAFSDGPAPRGALLHQLGVWLRTVHDRGIYHDDWSPKNILAAETGTEWRFWFLDTESISARKTLNERRRAKNLAQLSDAPYGITSTDRLRLLRAYAPDGAWRRLAPAALPLAQQRERGWVRVKARALRATTAPLTGSAP